MISLLDKFTVHSFQYEALCILRALWYFSWWSRHKILNYIHVHLLLNVCAAPDLVVQVKFIGLCFSATLLWTLLDSATRSVTPRHRSELRKILNATCSISKNVLKAGCSMRLTSGSDTPEMDVILSREPETHKQRLWSITNMISTCKRLLQK